MATKVKNESPSSSYTMLQVGDVEAIGAHCQMPFCHQLDFLPFRCDSCHSTFCLDHRSETAHKCARAGEWARNRRRNSIERNSTSPSSAAGTTTSKPTLQTGTQCYHTQCRSFVDGSRNIGVRCDRCHRLYCLKHRMQEDHDCKNVVPLGSRAGAGAAQQSNAEKIRFGFDKLRNWGKSQMQQMPLPKPKATSAAARVAELNKLKREAKGDDKIAIDKRLYLHVNAERAHGAAEAKIPEAKLFFNNTWTVGRMLDEAAKRLQVANLNNMAQTEDQRLRVYHVEAGRLLEFGEKLGTCLQSGNTVVLLRGVGPVAAS